MDLSDDPFTMTNALTMELYIAPRGSEFVHKFHQLYNKHKIIIILIKPILITRPKVGAYIIYTHLFGVWDISIVLRMRSSLSRAKTDLQAPHF